MPFKDLELKVSYDSDETDLLDTFYRPILHESILYQRMTGYFSSTTFGLVMNEVMDFMEDGGRIKIITGVDLTEGDKHVIEEYVNGQTTEFDEYLIKEIDTIDQFLSDCSALMGWMLMKKVDGEAQLEIKIAIPEDNGEINKRLYHQKVGVFFDSDGDVISFEGSVNETGRGWTGNIESFKPSISWGDESDRRRVEDDKKRFEKFWNNKAKKTRIVDLPTAVKDKLLKMSPKSTADFQAMLKRVQRSFARNNLLRWGQREDTGDHMVLRDYQTNAIKKWLDNDFCGILEMATGTGKTFAALGCLNRLTQHTGRLVAVIACPYTHLVEQWRDSFEEYNSRIEKSWRNNDFTVKICSSDYPNWKKDLRREIKDFNRLDVSGKYFLDKLIIFTTHHTLTSSSFVELMKSVTGPTFLVADEVHALGAEIRFKNLMKYRYRLGLSATPDRYFDDEGTKNLKEYFGGTIEKFTIDHAIEKNVLASYRYIPHIVHLNDEEMVQYRALTRKIAKKLAAKNSLDEEKELSNFIEGERASIIAAAEEKYVAFNEILEQAGPLSQSLIYCHEKQLTRVTDMLFERGIVYHQITYREPTNKRNQILKQLAQEKYDAVMAVRCLDEGVDVPSVKMGIILASTGNPRQYIQRRGRLLRKAYGKKEAIIHDILVVPYATTSEREIYPFEKKIVQRELERYSDFARHANNREEAERLIVDVRTAYGL